MRKPSPREPASLVRERDVLLMVPLSSEKEAGDNREEFLANIGWAFHGVSRLGGAAS